jgi:serine/threonine protein kinase
MAADMPVDSFLDLLRQSGLVGDSQMLALLAEFTGEGAKPESSRALADELIRREILTDWQADMLLQGKHRGFRLGPHRILRPLGQGGMSKVFLAEHEMMRRRCAIKVLPTKYQEDPDLLARFHLEARAIAALDHPHIVRAYDFNKDVRYGKEIHYLVMEYVEGQDLRRMVDEQGPLDCRKAADFIRQAAEGLAHAHAAGFVHRDIKPANLLVDPNGVLKILDLGLALEGQETWDTSEGQQSAVGTADYVAPEQVMDSRNVDGRADIYSLGYTFYFLLTGRRPFPKSTLVELLMAHRVENPEPISNLRPDVPLELIEIVDRMTAKTPDLRFQTAKDVAERLQAWLRDSESRDYSRISALMAAAMRAKQPGPEGPPSKPESTAKAELELTFLDDEPAKSTAAKGVESHRTEPTKPPENDARERPRKVNPGDSGRTAALRPGDSGRTAAVSRAKADLLMELNTQPTLAPRPQFKHRGSSNSVFRSPWLWIALAVVVCALFLILAILSTLSDKPQPLSTKKPGQENHAPSEPSASPVQAPPEKHEAEQAKSPETPRPDKPSPPADVSKVPSFASGPRSSQSPDKKSPTTTPSTSLPKPAPAEKEKKDTPRQPPQQPEKPAVADKEKLLASVTTISFLFVDSDPQQAKEMNPIVKRRASDAANQLRPPIEVVKTSPNVMTLELKDSTDSNSPGLVLRAELKCRAADGSDVPVWTLTKQVVVLRVRQDLATKKILLRPGATEFFREFVISVREARSKIKPN